MNPDYKYIFSFLTDYLLSLVSKYKASNMASGTPLIKSSTKASREKEEIGQNIQVFVRSRPLNQNEKDKKAFSIVEIPSIKQIDVKEKPNTNLTKSYQFDRVFGPKSQQKDVYKSVVEPLIDQVISVFRCPNISCLL